MHFDGDQQAGERVKDRRFDISGAKGWAHYAQCVSDRTREVIGLGDETAQAVCRERSQAFDKRQRLVVSLSQEKKNGCSNSVCSL